MDKQISLLILAAGMGSRYGGLKQIEKIGPRCDFEPIQDKEVELEWWIYGSHAPPQIATNGVQNVQKPIRGDFGRPGTDAGN